MTNSSTFEFENDSFYRIAQNILTDCDDITACIDSATKAVAQNRQANPDIIKARLTRHFAFRKYLSYINSDTGNDNNTNTNMSDIMAELQIVTAALPKGDNNNNENIIPLQLSDIADKFLRTLSSQKQSIFIRRYFFADSIADIAKDCHTSVNTVRTALTKANEELATLLSSKGFIVKTETLFESFMDIGDDLLAVKATATDTDLADAETTETKTAASGNRRFIPFIGCGVALVLVILLIVLITMDGSSSDDELSSEDASLKAFTMSEFVDDGYVNIDKLLAYTDLYSSSFIDTDTICYEGYLLSYSNYELSDNSVLKYCLGNRLDATTMYSASNAKNCVWYTLYGHDDMQCLIRDADGEYTLWLFSRMEQQNYNLYDDELGHAYGDTLSIIYDIESVDDITHIMVSPDTIFTTSNTTSSENEIASGFTVTDEDEITYILFILKNMTYSGSNQWETIIGDNNFSDIYSTAVQITLVTTKGEYIDNLYYSHLSGCFFEDSGIVYSTLTQTENSQVKDILYTPLSEYISDRNSSDNALTPTGGDVTEDDNASNEGTTANNKGNIGKNDIIKDGYVNTDTLLSLVPEDAEKTLSSLCFSLDSHLVSYQQIALEDTDILGYCMGENINTASNIYRLLGHDDAEFIITIGNDGFSLWRFSRFDNSSSSSSYSYEDVLLHIYNIASVEDIESVTVSSTSINDTETVKNAQANIIEQTYYSSEDISIIYNALINANCENNLDWSTSQLIPENGTMSDAVQHSRTLTIVTKDGETLDGISYTAIGHFFFSVNDSDIGFTELDSESAKALESFLGIGLAT